jgi:predicted transcriptional regulator
MSSLSVRLTPDVQKRLRAEAQARSQDVAEVAVAAIESYLDGQAEKRNQALDAVAAADQGVFISSDRMNSWIRSWGTEQELAPPEPDIFRTGNRSPR